MTILQDLELAWNQEIRKLICYSDSLTAVDLVAQPPCYAHLYAAQIELVLLLNLNAPNFLGTINIFFSLLF